VVTEEFNGSDWEKAMKEHKTIKNMSKEWASAFLTRRMSGVSRSVGPVTPWWCPDVTGLWFLQFALATSFVRQLFVLPQLKFWHRIVDPLPSFRQLLCDLLENKYF
jgi:hypothetical protein